MKAEDSAISSPFKANLVEKERELSESSTSILLSDRRPSPSYVVGYDGQAKLMSEGNEYEEKKEGTLTNKNFRRSDLSEKLTIAEKQFMKTQ